MKVSLLNSFSGSLSTTPEDEPLSPMDDSEMTLKEPSLK